MGLVVFLTLLRVCLHDIHINFFFNSQLNFIKREGWLALLLCSKLAESNVFILIELHFQSDLRLGLVGPASFNFQNTALGVVANSMMSYLAFVLLIIQFSVFNM
jgi:hypothetical protein